MARTGVLHSALITPLGQGERKGNSIDIVHVAPRRTADVQETSSTLGLDPAVIDNPTSPLDFSSFSTHDGSHPCNAYSIPCRHNSRFDYIPSRRSPEATLGVFSGNITTNVAVSSDFSEGYPSDRSDLSNPNARHSISVPPR